MDITADFLNKSDLESTYTIEPEFNKSFASIASENYKTDQTAPSFNDGYGTAEDDDNDDDDDDDDDKETEKQDVTETVEILKEMADIFNSKLSLEAVNLCSKLIMEEGADPNALAAILKNWRKKKAPKPKRILGHFFDRIESTEKKEWIP